MPRKPETTFTQSVLRHLPKDIYHIKMNNPYTGGVPDMWFSGNRSDLWVEFKFITRIPSRVDVRPGELLSVLQTEWLNGRYNEGRQVAVVIGCPDGGVILRDQEWMWNYTPQMFRDQLVPRQAIAQWITQATTR